MQSTAMRTVIRAVQPVCSFARRCRQRYWLGAGPLLVFLALDDFFAAVIPIGAYMMAAVHLAGGRLDRRRRVGKEIVRAMHATPRRGLLVLLDCHGNPLGRQGKVRDCTQQRRMHW